MTNIKELTCLKKLRDRWKGSPWKEKKEKIIRIIKNSKILLEHKIDPESPEIDDRFRSTYFKLMTAIQGLPYADELFNKVDLRGVDFEGEDFNSVWLWDVDLSGANLRNTIFVGAHFKGIMLLSADLLGATLISLIADSIFIGEYSEKENITNLSKTNLLYAKFKDTRGYNIVYGKYDLTDKVECEIAEGSYRVLKNFFNDLGKYQEADKCYRQEMISKRKQKAKIYQLIDWIFRDLTCGYGMRPWNVFGWIAGIIFLFMCLYFFVGDKFIYSGNIETTFSIKNALYLSLVTFTTLGLGDWHPNPNSSIQYWVAAEALLGFIFLTLWIITLARKIIRS